MHDERDEPSGVRCDANMAVVLAGAALFVALPAGVVTLAWWWLS